MCNRGAHSLTKTHMLCHLITGYELKTTSFFTWQGSLKKTRGLALAICVLQPNHQQRRIVSVSSQYIQRVYSREYIVTCVTPSRDIECLVAIAKQYKYTMMIRNCILAAALAAASTTTTSAFQPHTRLSLSKPRSNNANTIRIRICIRIRIRILMLIQYQY